MDGIAGQSQVATRNVDVEAEHRLHLLAVKTAYKIGDDFFAEVVAALAEILQVKHVLLSECVGQPPTRTRTLAFYSANRLCENFEYDLKGTPCQLVIEQGSYFCPRKVQELFPTDADLVGLEAESYGGLSLFDSQGNVVGHLCYIGIDEIVDSTFQMPALKLIQARCGAEIERIRLERIRADEQRVLEETQKLAALGTLAAGIAHEINNPLTSIQLSADLTKRELEAKSLPTNDVDSIMESVQSISQIVDGVLRVSSNRESVKATCDLTGLIHRAIDLTSHLYEPKRLSVKFEAANNRFVLANPLELQQVFVNLITNAIHASVGPRQTIDVLLESQAGHHIVTVRNYGIEIPEGEQDRIFDPFYTTRKSEGGTGLGLSVSLEIVQAHGGEISVSSDSDGTSFFVQLPIQDGQPIEDCNS